MLATLYLLILTFNQDVQSKPIGSSNSRIAQSDSVVLVTDILSTDRLEKLASQGDLNELRRQALKLLELDQGDGKARYYLSLSFSSDNPQQVIAFIDSLLALKSLPSNSIWTQRLKSLRVSNMRRNGSYALVMQEARQLLKSTVDSIALANTFRALSISFRKLSQYDSALYWGLELEKLAAKRKDKYTLHQALQNKANLYDALNQRGKTIGIEKELLVIADNLGNIDLQILDRCNLGSSYINFSMLDSAYFFFNEALELAEENNNRKRIPLILYNIASLEEEKKNYSEVIRILLRCLPIAEETYQPSIISLSHYLLALSYFKTGELANYKNHLQLGYEVIEEHGFLQDKLYFLELEFEVANDAKDYQHAIGMLQSIRVLEDSILNNERLRAIDELETKYETEKKNKEIELLISKSAVQQLVIQQQRALIIGVVIIILIIGTFLLLFIRQRTLRKDLQLLNTKNKLLRSQMNPHFLFNAISAIQQFIYEKRDPYETGDYIGRFARLTRMILDYSQVEVITLQEEIDFLKHYLELQQLRFDKPFQYSILCDDISNRGYVLIPPMITQPFLENSIEHGILSRESGGEIRIDFVLNEEDETITIVIEDNGIGREKASFNKKNAVHKSQAVCITEERLSTLAKRHRRKTTLKIDDVVGSNDEIVGTKVTLQLPFIKEKY